jgi:hypothetical protein
MDEKSNRVVEAQHKTDRSEYGFTPHLIEFKELVGNTVYHETLCLMDGCGIEIFKDEKGEKIFFTRHDTRVFLLDGEAKYYDNNNILREVTEKTVLHYKAKIIKMPEQHSCTLGNWMALVELFQTPSI